MSASGNLMSVYQPNETVRLDVRLENEVQTKVSPCRCVFYEGRRRDARALALI